MTHLKLGSGDLFEPSGVVNTFVKRNWKSSDLNLSEPLVETSPPSTSSSEDEAPVAGTKDDDTH